jgi:hypothetical protein
VGVKALATREDDMRGPAEAMVGVGGAQRASRSRETAHYSSATMRMAQFSGSREDDSPRPCSSVSARPKFYSLTILPGRNPEAPLKIAAQV